MSTHKAGSTGSYSVSALVGSSVLSGTSSSCMEKLLMQSSPASHSASPGPTTNPQIHQPNLSAQFPTSQQANPPPPGAFASLLGMAEHFRTMSPPNIRLCVHCLKSALFYQLPLDAEARTHLQIGKLLLQHSKSDGQIKAHLEQARLLGSHLSPPDDVIKFEAADLLADFYEKRGKRYEANCILSDAMPQSNNNPYWHCRLLLKLAQAHVSERDISSACEILAMGSQFAQMHQSDYTRGLFLLSKCMLLLASRQLPEVINTLTVANRLIENLNGMAYQKEALRTFYLIVSVSHWLLTGQAKSARQPLKQLHSSIQSFAMMDEDLVATTEIDMFQWMPREHMVVLVYLMTVMQSMQGGMMERAQKYTEKGITQIEKMAVLDMTPILSVFHLCFLEHMILYRLVMGNMTGAVQEISQAIRLCHQNAALGHRRGPQLHCLLGLYAMSMNCMEEAENQFKLTLKLITQQNSYRVHSAGDMGHQAHPLMPVTKDPLYILVSLNLALVNIRQDKIADCQAILDEVCSDSASLEACHGLYAASFYVRGFKAFCEANYAEAKTYLRETLRLSNGEDLTRLTASALTTLGQISMNMKKTDESKNIIQSAIMLANKMPDISVQLWATALLKDAFNLYGDREQEMFWFNEHQRFSQSVIQDHHKASESAEHVLIQWLDEHLPELPATSSANSML